MNLITQLMDEVLLFPGVLDIATRSADTYDSDRVSLEGAKTVTFLVIVGTMASSATLNVSLRQATAASGGSTKAISNSSITEIDEDGDNRLVLIRVRDDALDVDNDYDHVYARAVVAGGNATFAIVPIAAVLDDMPADNSSYIAESIDVPTA